MMNGIWVGLILFSYIFSFFAGTTEDVTNAIFTGSGSATQLIISILGMLCVWTGLLDVAEKAGITKKVERLLSPVISFLFPALPEKSPARSAISMSMTANLLGISNAATPLGLSAMEHLSERSLTPHVATDEMCMFVVINSASITLLPTTLLTLRQASGSGAPFEVLIPIWICSFLSVSSGIIAAKCYARRGKK